MCLTCGCGLPYESHGDPRNITVNTIKEAVNTPQAKGQTTEEAVLQTLPETWRLVSPNDRTYQAPLDTDQMVGLFHKPQGGV